MHIQKVFPANNITNNYPQLLKMFLEDRQNHVYIQTEYQLYAISTTAAWKYECSQCTYVKMDIVTHSTAQITTPFIVLSYAHISNYYQL